MKTFLALSCAALLLLMPALAGAQSRPTGGGTTVGTAEPRGGGSSGTTSTGSSSGSERGGSNVTSGGTASGSVSSSPANIATGRYDGPRSGEAAGFARARNAGSNTGQAVPASERPRGDRPTYGYATPRTEARGTVANNTPTYYGYPWYDGYYGSRWGGGVYDLGYYWPGTYFWGPRSYFINGYPYWWYDPYLAWSGLGALYGYGMYTLPLTGYGSFWYDTYYGASSPPYVESATGSIKLKVKPKDAEVYVDGTFYGTVDHYDGVFQSLGLRAGAHKFEIRANGYEPLTFQVRVLPGRSITYRGELKAIK